MWGKFFFEVPIRGSRRYGDFLGDTTGPIWMSKHENTTATDSSRRAA